MKSFITQAFSAFSFMLLILSSPAFANEVDSSLCVDVLMEMGIERADAEEDCFSPLAEETQLSCVEELLNDQWSVEAAASECLESTEALSLGSGRIGRFIDCLKKLRRLGGQWKEIVPACWRASR